MVVLDYKLLGTYDHGSPFSYLAGTEEAMPVELLGHPLWHMVHPPVTQKLKEKYKEVVS